MTIAMLYEDGEALVIDKPAGLPVDGPKRGGSALFDHVPELSPLRRQWLIAKAAMTGNPAG